MGEEGEETRLSVYSKFRQMFPVYSRVSSTFSYSEYREYRSTVGLATVSPNTASTASMSSTEPRALAVPAASPACDSTRLTLPIRQHLQHRTQKCLKYSGVSNQTAVFNPKILRGLAVHNPEILPAFKVTDSSLL